MYANAKKEVVNIWDQYVDEKGTTYPSNFPKEQISGLTKVTETDRPANKVVTGFTVDANYKQVWTARDKLPAEIEAEVIAKRLEILGSPQDQLDYMFENGFDAWRAHVAQVHEENPLPV